MSRSWIGGIISIFVMAGIVVISNNPGQEPDSRLGAFMLPGLQGDLSSISKVIIKNKEKITTLLPVDSQWTVQEKYGFDADFVKLSGLLKSLASSKLTERKTSKPENFSRLGVDSDSPEATDIEVFAGDNSYTVLIGNAVSNRTGHYIRLVQHESEANQVWLVDKALTSSSDPAEWLHDEVIDVEADRVQELTFSQGEHSLSAKRSDGELALVDLPEDAELRYPSIVDSLARALMDIRLQDVVPIGNMDFGAAKKATFNLDDDSKIKVELVDADGKHWLRLLDHTSSQWAFEVSSVVYGNLTKELDDLLKQENNET